MVKGRDRTCLRHRLDNLIMSFLKFLPLATPDKLRKDDQDVGNLGQKTIRVSLN